MLACGTRSKTMTEGLARPREVARAAYLPPAEQGAGGWPYMLLQLQEVHHRRRAFKSRQSGVHTVRDGVQLGAPPDLVPQTKNPF